MINILLPMVKFNINFENYEYYDSKNLIEIAKRPIIQYVYDNYKDIKDAIYTFIIEKEENERYHLSSLIKLLNPDAKIIVAQGKTRGAACSCLLAIEQIDNDDELLIVNCEQYLNSNMQDVIDLFRKKNFDGGIVTFPSIHPRWSYVRLDDNEEVIETAEKRPISSYATAGIYYFKKGHDFIEGAQNMILKGASVNDNYYLCPVYNELILLQKIIGIHNVNGSDYFSFSTKKGLDEFITYALKNLI